MSAGPSQRLKVPKTMLSVSPLEFQISFSSEEQSLGRAQHLKDPVVGRGTPDSLGGSQIHTGLGWARCEEGAWWPKVD